MYRSKTTFDPSLKIWSGSETEYVFSKHISIGHAVLYNLNNSNPNKVLQISHDTGVRLTNNDIRIRSIEAALFYQKIGLQKGDIVGFYVKNSDNLTPLILGAFICGVIVNGLFPGYETEYVVHSFNQTEPKLIFCDDDNFETVKHFLNQTNLKPLVYTVNKKIENVPNVSEFITGEESDSVTDFKFPALSDAEKCPAVIAYSSGTTGPPKGILISHATLLGSLHTNNITSEDIVFTFATLNAVTSYYLTLLALINGATKIITTKNFTPDYLLEIIDKYKVTTMLAPPSFLAILLHNIEKGGDLSSLRYCITGGGLLNQHLVRELNLALPKCKIVNTYGMSEGGVIAINEKVRKTGSVGQLSPGIRIKIIDRNGKAVGPLQHGEVLIHPPCPFLGYFKKPVETKEAYDEDGWVHTGDIGYFDDDHDLVLVNRIKDLLVNKDNEFFPTDIEDVIMEMPEVNQVCVVGISDGCGNDIPTALVVQKSSANLSENDILEYTKDRLINYMQLQGGVFFVKTLPLSYAGKYKRDLVKVLANDLVGQKVK